MDLGERLFSNKEIVVGLAPFRSHLVAVTGISTGDEGKGRTIPDAARILRAASGRPDVVGLVFKVNGGANSGHTADGLKLNLLPAGIGDPLVPCLGVGRGVVADPMKFLWEGVPLESAGHAVFSRLLIDHRVMVSDITHRVLDKVQEAQREVPRGSTGRGISPSYADEVGQYVVHYADFLGSRDQFAKKMTERIQRAEGLAAACTRVAPERWKGFFEELTAAELKANKDSIDRKLFSADDFDLTRFCGPRACTFNAAVLVDAYWEAGQRLKACISSLSDKIFECQQNGQYVFGEFGQAYWLDKRHGFSPNVTASHTYTPEFFQSGNIPAQPIHNIGVCKGYDTKVGTHVFLTEIGDEHPLGKALRMIEFGTTTGRQRMVGWYDAVEKGYVLRHGGFDEMAINKIDVLTMTTELAGAWDGVLKVCHAYRLPDGQVTNRMPHDDATRRACTPEYIKCPSWSEDISGVRSFAQLPVNAQRYVATLYRATIEAAYGDDWPAKELPPIRLIGVGPDSSQVILDAQTPARLMGLAMRDSRLG
jgi:adenylosuccinate synthase